jgi:hypothetical protein
MTQEEIDEYNAEYDREEFLAEQAAEEHYAVLKEIEDEEVRAEMEAEDEDIMDDEIPDFDEEYDYDDFHNALVRNDCICE